MKRGLPVRTDYSVLAEEEEWMVVGKPAPLIVHPSNDQPERTLLGELQKQSPGQNFHMINRLDRETSGCVLIARSKRAAGILGKEMMAHRIRKTYQAIVRGWPDWDDAEVDQAILRSSDVEESRIWVKQVVHPDGKASCTRFRCLERFEKRGALFAVVECTPVTGRMHQIRVHLQHAGLPIVGDKIYGGDEDCYLDFLRDGWSVNLESRLLLDRQALHGNRIEFYWEGREIEVECPWPEDLRQFRLGEEVREVLDDSHGEFE